MHTFQLLGGVLILVLVKILFDKRTSTSTASSATQGSDSSSSSSSLPSPGWDYEVFLSFKGEDTRTNFTDHLYNALVNRGIHTFRDNEGLRIGEKIDTALRSVIHHSKICIPIFSKNYASSKWCLRELAEIVECMKQEGQRQVTVMPVFYHVDPSDVRYQIGCYEEAFQKHKKRYGQETEGWKKALKEVADLKGWDLKNIANGHEAELIKLLIKEVWSVLRKSPLIVTDDLVGIDFHEEEMKKLLEIESNDLRVVVGIHGLGGIGKTTIARCVYNAFCHDFNRCSFIAGARETIRIKGPIHLQSQLIRNILNMENPDIGSVDEGIQLIGDRLSNKRVLIVFDDVDFDLNSIIGKHNRFGFGSRIIITTRDKHILDVFGVDKTYEPREMDFDQSLQLFSRHAFKMDHPPKHYLDLSKDVVETTGGLPLALEVIGSSLFCATESTWKNMVKKLKIIPNEEVQKKLRISYDGLDRVQKEMFLDIACFLIGMDTNIACYIWDGLELDVLHQKSLVKIDANDEIQMHDQLRDLGREIVCQENPKELGKRSRLWLEEDVMDVLNTQMGSRKVEGLCVDFSEQDDQSLMSEGFAAMTNLRLLKLDYASVSGNFMHSFSQLRWLSWKGCHDIQFPLTNPRKLAVLDLSFSYITESWKGWSYVKEAKNLKVLDLSNSRELYQTPNLSENLKLEALILQHCVNLAVIDNSIGHLKRLVVLNMTCCTSLEELPTSICELRSLKRLDISGCDKISQLPDELGRLEALMELIIDLTPIERLPNSIGDLRNLKTLNANYCNIQEGGIPNDIGRLSSLEILKLRKNQFRTLPATVSRLSLLQKFCLESCGRLQSLPQLSNLTNLRKLRLDSCKSLMELPITMDAVTRLESLSLKRCTALQYVSHLPSGLTWLAIEHCANVREIGSFEGLDSLQTFRINSCDSLSKFPNVRGLRNLKSFSFFNCPKLEEFESVEELDSLQTFQINSCDSLKKFPNLRGLRNLESFFVFNCPKVEHFGSLEGLDSLHTFQTHSLYSLSKLPNLRGLKKLRNLILRYVGLAEIEGLEGLFSLKNLFIYSCHSLRKISNLSGLDSLEELKLEGCHSLRKIQLPPKLRRLYIGSKLTEIEGLADLESLEEIEIIDTPSVLSDVSTLKNLKLLRLFGCNCVERLPELSNLNKLSDLRIEECGKLIEVPSVGKLESLEILRVYSCESLEILPDLSNLSKLRTLRIVDCRKLTEIQGVDSLEILEDLCIDECISIETLPSLSRLRKLKSLSAVDCEKLTVIKGLDELGSVKLNFSGGCPSMEFPYPPSVWTKHKFVGPNSGDCNYDDPSLTSDDDSPSDMEL